MAMADRHYMYESPERKAPWPLAVVLMVTLIVAYALQCINDVYIRAREVDGWLALTTWGLERGWVWQLFTFQFLHANLWHLIGNCVGLWMFGRHINDLLGRKRFLIAYFGTALTGALLQAGLMLVFPQFFGPMVVGASAGVSGIFAIFCRLESQSDIRWNFILPIKAEVLLWIYVGVEAFFTLVPTHREMGIAHAAHLGGLLAGMAFVHCKWHHEFQPLPWEGWLGRFRRRKPSAVGSVPLRESAGPVRKKSPVPPVEPEGEFISKQVDPILDKISAQGMHSLTPEEREILEKARQKMSRR